MKLIEITATTYNSPCVIVLSVSQLYLSPGTLSFYPRHDLYCCQERKRKCFDREGGGLLKAGILHIYIIHSNFMLSHHKVKVFAWMQMHFTGIDQALIKVIFDMTLSRPLVKNISLSLNNYFDQNQNRKKTKGNISTINAVVEFLKLCCIYMGIKKCFLLSLDTWV